jgi:PAS domain S-box-containing protein
MKIPLFKSLKFRLVFLSFVIQSLVIVFLIINSSFVSQQYLTSQAERNLSDLKYSINASLGSALIAKDYGTMKSIIDELTEQKRIVYIAIEVDGKLMMTSKYDAKIPLPKLSESIDDGKTIYHTFANIEFYGQKYATVYFGFDTTFLNNAAEEQFTKNLVIGGFGLLLSLLFLGVLHSFLTKSITKLTSAVEEIAQGNFTISLKSTSQDEIGILTNSFNSMVETINAQIKTIKETNYKFQTISDYTYSWENWFGNDGKLLWINPAVTRITGYSIEETMTMDNFPFCIIFPEDLPAIEKIHQSALQGSRGQDIEFRIIAKSKDLVWVAMSWHMVYDEHNNPLGYRSSIRDISLEHDITQQLSQKESINQILEKRINEGIETLREKDLILIQQTKMAAMGEMIANIAHQWRQPLSAISSSASALQLNDELGILSKDSLHSYTGMIIKNCIYLSDTIDNFRNFFNPNQEKSFFILSNLIDDVLNIFGTYFLKHQIEIEKNIEEAELFAFANGLQQILLNFIKNAKDAIGENGVIVITTKHTLDGHMLISVQDSGGGIPDSVIDKIFDPYFTTKHKSQGTGIGLNMSYQIAQNHLQGNIFASNKSFSYNGKEFFGANFELLIPIQQPK